LLIEALALARRRTDLQPRVKATFEKLDGIEPAKDQGANMKAFSQIAYENAASSP